VTWPEAAVTIAIIVVIGLMVWKGLQ